MRMNRIEKNLPRDPPNRVETWFIQNEYYIRLVKLLTTTKEEMSSNGHKRMASQCFERDFHFVSNCPALSTSGLLRWSVDDDEDEVFYLLRRLTD